MKIAWVGGFNLHPEAMQIKGIRQAMQEGGYDELYLDIMAENDVFKVSQELIRFKPDVLIVLWQHFFEEPKWCKAARENCKRVVFWWVDLNYHAKPGGLNHIIDAVFLSNMSQIPWYEYQWDFDVDKIHYLPDGTFRYGLLNKIPKNQATPDLLFIGNLDPVTYKTRVSYLNALTSLGIDMKVVPRQEWVAFNAMWKIQPSMYRSAKMNLSVSITNRVKGYTSSRLFDQAGSGAFILAERFPGCENLFEPDKEVVFFQGEQDLLEKAVFYLAHPEERERIAAAAFQRVQQSHTMSHRLAKILETVK